MPQPRQQDAQAHGICGRELAGLEPLHEQVVALLGACCEKLSNVEE